MPDVTRSKSILEQLDEIEIPEQGEWPVWKGPYEDGVTFSLLSRFLVCRERFRVMFIEGWRTVWKFTPSIDYGNLWHVAEEEWEKGNKKGWAVKVGEYANKLLDQYPGQAPAIVHWTSYVQTLYPKYQEYWSAHPDVVRREPLFQERVFDVKYTLPSGRKVRLRGKIDSADIITLADRKMREAMIQENKSKTQLDQGKIFRQITYDLQSMIYSLVFDYIRKSDPAIAKKLGKMKYAGVRYNVVRRSQHKTSESMMKTVTEDLKKGHGGEWFCRWFIPISSIDISRFQHDCFDPILEGLCDWWEWQEANGFEDPKKLPVTPLHYRYPYGIYNILHEGGLSDIDAYLENGSTLGLRRVIDMFPELKE